MSPDETVLNWLYVKDQQFNKDLQVSEAFMSMGCIHYILYFSQYPVIALPFLVLLLLITMQGLKTVYKKRTRRNKRRNTNMKLSTSAAMIQLEPVTTFKRVPRHEQRFHNQHSQCFILDRIYFFFKLIGLIRRNQQASFSEDITVQNMEGSTFKLMTSSPKKKKHNLSVKTKRSDSKSIISSGRANGAACRSSSNKAAQPRNSGTRVGSLIKIPRAVTCCTQKPINPLKRKAVAICKANKVAGAASSTSNGKISLRRLGNEKTTNSSQSLPHNSIRNVRETKVYRKTLDPIDETASIIYKKLEKSGEGNVDSCDISALAIDKFGEMQCLRATEQLDKTAMFLESNGANKRYEPNERKLDLKPEKRVTQTETVSGSEAHHLSVVMTSKFSKFDDHANDRMDSLLIVKQLNQTMADECFNVKRSSPMTEQHQSMHVCEEVTNNKTDYSCLCTHHKMHATLNISSSGSAMAVDKAAIDLMSGDFSSICRKYNERQESYQSTYSASSTSRMFGNADSETIRHDGHKDQSKTTANWLCKGQKMVGEKLKVNGARIRSRASCTRSFSLGRSDDESRVCTQTRIYDNDRQESFFQVSSFAKSPGRYSRKTFQVTPKPSRKLVLPQSKLENAFCHFGRSSDDDMRQTHLESRFSRICLNYGGCNQMNARKSWTAKKSQSDSSTCTTSATDPPYANPNQITRDDRAHIRQSLLPLQESFRHRRMNMYKDKSDGCTCGFGIANDHQDSEIKLLAYSPHSSSHLSPMMHRHINRVVSIDRPNGQKANKCRETFLKDTAKQKECGDPDYKYMPLHLFESRKQKRQKIALQACDNSALSLYLACLDTDNSHESDNTSVVDNLLLRYAKSPSQLRGATSFKNESDDNIPAWRSSASSCQSRSTNSMSYADPQMEKNKHIAGNKKGTIPSNLKNRYSVLNRGIQQRFQGRCDTTSQSVVTPRKKKHTVTASSQSHHQTRMKQVTEDANIFSPDYGANALSTLSSLFHDKKSKEAQRPIQHHNVINEASNPQVIHQGSESGKLCEEIQRNMSRRLTSSKITKVDTHQSLQTHVLNSGKYSRPLKSYRSKKGISQNDKTQLENFQQVYLNLFSQRRQDHIQRKRFQPKRKTDVKTTVLDSDANDVLNCSRKRIKSQKSKSPSFAHMPLFGNNHNETVNITRRLDSSAEKTLIEKHTTESCVGNIDAYGGNLHPKQSGRRRKLETTKSKFILPKQEQGKKLTKESTSISKGIAFLSENQNASPRRFNNRQQSKKIRNGSWNDQHIFPDTVDSLHRLNHLGCALLSNQENCGRLGESKHEADFKEDMFFLNDLSEIKQYANSDNDFSNHELISTNTSTLFQEEQNGSQDATRTDNYAYSANQYSNKQSDLNTAVKPKYALQPALLTTDNKQFLLRKDYQIEGIFKKEQENKTSNMNLSTKHSPANQINIQCAQISQSNDKQFNNAINGQRHNSKKTTPTMGICYQALSNTHTNSKHLKRANYFLYEIRKNKEGVEKIPTDNHALSSKDYTRTFTENCSRIPTFTKDRTNISKQDRVRIQSENNTKLTKPDSIQITNENHTKTYVDHFRKTPTGIDIGISSQDCTGILSYDHTGISSEDRNRAITETRIRVQTGNHIIVHNDSCSIQNGEHAMSKNPETQSTINRIDLVDSQSSRQRHEQLHPTYQPRGRCTKRYNGGTDSVRKEKWDQNAEAKVSMNDHKQLSNSDSEDAGARSEDLMPKEEITKTHDDETNYFNTQLNSQFTSRHLKDYREMTHSRKQWKMAREKDRDLAKMTEKISGTSKTRIRRGSNTTVSRTGKVSESMQIPLLRRDCLGENVSGAHINKRPLNDYINSVKRNEQADCKVGCDDDATYSHDDSGVFPKPLQVSVRSELYHSSSDEAVMPILFKQDSFKNGKISVHKKCDQITNLKQVPQRINTELRIPITCSTAKNRRVNKVLSPSTTLSTLPIKIEGSPNVSQSSKFQPFYGKMVMSCFQQEKVEQLLPKKNEEINSILFGRMRAMQNPTSYRLPVHETPTLSESSIVLGEARSHKNYKRKLAKANEMCASRCIGQDGRKQARADENKHRTNTGTNNTSPSHISTTQLCAVESTSNIKHHLKYSNIAQRRDSALISIDNPLKSLTQDKLRKPNRLQEILLKKMFTFCAGEDRLDDRKESADKQPGHRHVCGLQTQTGHLGAMSYGAPMMKSLHGIINARKVFDDTSNVDAQLRDPSHGANRYTLKMINIPEKKCDPPGTSRSHNLHSVDSKRLQLDSKDSPSKLTVAKNRGVVGSPDLGDVENTLTVTSKDKQDLDSDLQTFVESNFDETDRLPDSLPGKIGGSTDVSSNEDITSLGFSKDDTHLTYGKADNPVIHNNNVKSTPFNVDELREKYLKEIRMRGSNKSKPASSSSYGMNRDYLSHLPCASSGSNTKRYTLSSDTTPIRSASSGYSVPKTMASGNTLTVIDSRASQSVYPSSKIGFKRKRGDDKIDFKRKRCDEKIDFKRKGGDEKIELKRKRGENEKLHFPELKTVGKIKNSFTHLRYGGRSLARNRFGIATLPGEEIKQQPNRKLESQEAVVKSDAVRPSLIRGADQIWNIWEHQSNSDVSLNHSCGSGSYTACSFACPQNKQQPGIKQSNYKLPEETRSVRCRDESHKIHDMSQANRSVNISLNDNSQHMQQTLRSSDTNKTKNASYTLMTTNSQDMHDMLTEQCVCKSGSKISDGFNAAGIAGKSFIKNKSSRIPMIQRRETVSNRKHRSDTQCISRTGFAVLQKQGERNIQQNQSSLYNKCHTTNIQRQFVRDTQSIHSNYNDCNTTMSYIRRQKSNTGAMSHGSSTDVVISWCDKSNVQEQLQHNSEKDAPHSEYSNCDPDSTLSALNYPKSTAHDSRGYTTAVPNNLRKLMNKTEIDKGTEVCETERSAKNIGCGRSDVRGILNANPKHVQDRMRKLLPLGKHLFEKMRKSSTNKGEITNAKLAERPYLSRATKQEPNLFPTCLAGDATRGSNSAFGKTTRRSKDREFIGEFRDTSTSEKRHEDILKESEANIFPKQEEHLKSSSLKDQGKEHKVVTNVRSTLPVPARPFKSLGKNIKYVNSALMYNMKKQNTMYPYKQHGYFKQRHFTVNDPALGKNNSAQLDSNEILKNCPFPAKAPVCEIEVSRGGSKPALSLNGRVSQSSIGKLHKDSTMYHRQDQNAVYFFASREPTRDKTRQPITKSEMSGRLPEKEYAEQRAGLPNEKCGTTVCGPQQRTLSYASFCNFDLNSNKIGHAADTTQDGHNHLNQHVQDGLLGQDLQDDKDEIPETYRTNSSMFVVSDSSKVSFDWYKPSATSTLQTSENGLGQLNGSSSTEGNGHSSRAFLSPSTVETRYLSGFSLNSQGNNVALNNSECIPAQEQKSMVERSRHPRLSRDQHVPRHTPTLYQEHHVSNFSPDNTECLDAQTHAYEDPKTYLFFPEPNSNVSYDTVLPTQQDQLQNEIDDRFLNHLQATRAYFSSDIAPAVCDNRHNIAHVTRSASRRLRKYSNQCIPIPTEDVSVSNLNTLYQKLQHHYNQTNAVFHSNWVLANQNTNLNLLTDSRNHFDYCNNTTTSICSSQTQPILQHNYPEIHDNFRGACFRPGHTHLTSKRISHQPSARSSFISFQNMLPNHSTERSVLNQARVDPAHYRRNHNFMLVNSHNRGAATQHNIHLNTPNVYSVTPNTFPLPDVNRPMRQNVLLRHHRYVQTMKRGALPQLTFVQNQQSGQRDSDRATGLLKTQDEHSPQDTTEKVGNS